MPGTKGKSGKPGTNTPKNQNVIHKYVFSKKLSPEND